MFYELWLLLFLCLSLLVVVTLINKRDRNNGTLQKGEPSSCLWLISPMLYLFMREEWQDRKLDEMKEQMAQQEERLAQVESPAAAPAERWSCACGNINPRSEACCLRCGKSC